MKISLFQGIVFGLFGLGALIGLFVFATHTSKSSNSSVVGKIVVWGTLSKEDMQAALTAVARTDTSLKDVSYVQEDPSTLPNDVAAAIATGAAPDLVLASQENLHSIAKFISPIPSTTLPASIFTSTFVGAGNLFAASSGYYGMPFLVDPLVLFSNRTILSSSGVAKPPSTWEALTGLVPKVAVLTSSRAITRGLISLGTYNNVHNARGILSALFIQAGIPISAYSSNGVFSSNLGESTSGASNGTPPGESVLSFYTQFADPSKISYTWNASMPDSQQAFLSGSLALYIGYASEAKYLKKANPNLDFIVSPLPQPATATVKSDYGLVYAFMIPAGAKNVAGAYQAAALLTNAAEQTAAASATGLAPAVLNELATVPSDPVAAVAYAEALYTKGWISPAAADVDSIFSGMITDVVSGRLTTAAALVSAGRSLNPLLQ